MQLRRLIAETTAYCDEHGWLCVCYNTGEYNNTGEEMWGSGIVFHAYRNASDTYSLYASQSSPDRKDIHTPL